METITLKPENTNPKNIEIKIPSYWKRYSGAAMITKDLIILVNKDAVNSLPLTHGNFTAFVGGLEEITEDEFMIAFNAAIEKLHEIVSENQEIPA